MDFELISAADYDALPEDQEDAFLNLEAICRKNMNRMLDEDYSREFEAALKLQYMATVRAAALEAAIPSLEKFMVKQDRDASDFPVFSLTVHGEVARLRLRKRKGVNQFSVLLRANTRTVINHRIDGLRSLIAGSDLPEIQKKALASKLDDLAREMDAPRVSFARTMALLGPILVGLASATTIAAEGPTAVAHIMRAIARDKESEDAAKHRLTPPPRALPAPEVVAKVSAPSWDSVPGLDDEIPF